MIFIALVFAAATMPQADLDVLTQSQSGKVLCSNPNAEAMTCSSVAAYSSTADGSVIETTEILLSPDESITLTMSIEVQVDGSSICGVMSLDDLKNGRVRLNGEPLSDDINSKVLERLKATFGSLAGKKTCEVIRFEGNGLVKYGQVDGLDIKLPGKPVKWIDAEEGYRVATS